MCRYIDMICFLEMEQLLITLLIFSGRPNPECVLKSDNPDYQSIIAMLPSPPGGVIQGGKQVFFSF